MVIEEEKKSIPPVELGKRELRSIRKDIRKTSRPSWQGNPPADFGSKGRGKLKADFWRTLIEFDLPVSLMRLWSMVETDGQTCETRGGIDNNGDQIMDDDAEDEEEEEEEEEDERESDADTERKRKMVASTMALASAIRWGISHRTSRQHQAKYLEHIEIYLQSIRELRPELDLRPIHHNAIHFAEFLRAFGPSHGWWMFPFERMIGFLQQINTNNKSGKWGHPLNVTYILTAL
jgi:hypothetical protein